MTKRFALSDMILDECSFVDKGANPGAKVVFWKRDEAVVDPARQNIANMTLHIDTSQITIAAAKNSEAVEKVKEMVGAAVKRSKAFLAKAGDWDESKHPREADGKFGGGGGVSSGADSGKTVDYVRAASALRSALKDFPPGNDPKLGVNRNEQARLKGLLSMIGRRNTRFSEEDKRVLRQVISRTKKSASFTTDFSKRDESITKLATDLATLHKYCGEVAATCPVSLQPAIAATFDELLERQDVQERAQEFSRMVYALQDSINSITNDPELRGDVRRDLLDRTLNEFKAAVEEEMGSQDQLEEDYMAKAAIQAAIAKSKLLLKGGSGSGNFGHAGRPGEIGGSSSEGGGGDGRRKPENIAGSGGIGSSNRPDEYGVRYRQADKRGNITVKEKLFNSQKKLDSFTSKLEQSDGFLAYDSWLFPPVKKNSPVKSDLIKCLNQRQRAT